jgi:formamidopyrimidine-DNA glycosylase
MPELPEAERARRQIERALGREIVAVDDRDTYVCRPHAPGEIAAALVGRRLTEAHRRGKFLWAETDGGPELGLHLGMAGSIVVDEPAAPNGWDRFSLEFAGGGRLALRDKRRLGRAVIEPDFSHVGPDAAEVDRALFRERIGRGTAPIKARLLDQRAISGVGNLLADEALWRARIHPARPAGELTVGELDRLRREVRAAMRSAIRRGGAHTGDLIPHRNRGDVCPRCGTPLERGTIGGRTTFWCPVDQPLSP